MRKEVERTAVDGEGAGEEQKGEEAALIVRKEDLEASELRIEPENMSVTRQILRKMKIEAYSPSMFLNPDLRRIYAG